MAPARRRRTLAQWFRMALATPDQREAIELEEIARDAGAQPVKAAQLRSRVRVCGTVVRARTVPESCWFEAVLDDGTGTVTLVWMGRPKVAGIVEGVKLLVSGRLTEQDGRKLIYNPEFEMLS